MRPRDIILCIYLSCIWGPVFRCIWERGSPFLFLAFLKTLSHLSLFRRRALIAKLFHRISTISRKIGNHESSLPLCISFFLLSSFLFHLECYSLLAPSVIPAGIFVAREQTPTWFALTIITRFRSEGGEKRHETRGDETTKKEEA